MANRNIVMLQFDTTKDAGYTGSKSAANDAGLSLMHQFHRASQLADELFVAELGDCKITPRQFVVLAAVRANVGANQTQIVQLTGIDRSTVADVIRRMVKLELLSRRRTKDDARAYSVRVTEHGEAVFRTAQEAAAKVDQALLARLMPEAGTELQQSLALLTGSEASH